MGEDSAERVVFDGLVLTEVSKRPQRADLPLYFGHELSYIRAVLHLAHRATAAVVTAIAKDQPPSPVEVESILDEVGKTVEELRTDVDKHRRRLELKALLATLPVIDRELAEIDRQIKEEDKQLELAESRHDEVTAPLYARKTELRETRMKASDVGRQLFATCEDPVLLDQLEQVRIELEELLRSNRELQTQISYLKSKADTERHRASRELNL